MTSPIPFRLALVVAGGAIGTAARLGLGLALPAPAGGGLGAVPWATLVANLLGAFLIGVLAARLPGSSAVRILLGTGVLGGFTTYSAFAVGTVTLWHTQPWLAAAYAAGSVVLGIGAAVLGLALARPRSAHAQAHG
ncbi:fluoride efflux transporter FluC [Microbacterium azadirachtae]|uniref:Fluoride-specific ion channel FluC n=1 Tax=Microbacterium azadirachtae TaxID=582680 RepID=A0A1I6HBM3_9MICO|nr:CrcB family protein [Microbacterium azadirachtae]SFR51677.1 camphor resistance protein CrcB [Microbacterium azadirachtae]